MTARFFRRPYPNANCVLLGGPRPVLVDSGTAGDEPALLAWLHAQGVAPNTLAALVNTHWHSDHTGGNHALAHIGVPIWAEAREAAVVDAWQPDPCRSRWLQQDVARYAVARHLNPGDTVDTGAASGRRWRVLALPGHSPAQIGLWDPCGRVLVAGDALHEADFGWLDTFADPAAVQRQADTLDLVARLAPGIVLSGHGPVIDDVPAALHRARHRLSGFRSRPDRAAWHACKRIFGHALMLEDGIARPGLEAFLLGAPWFQDYAAQAFGQTPAAFVPTLLNEMLRSGAARWDADRLVAATAYRPPQASPSRR